MNPIMKKIAALLALASSAAGTPEGANAMEKAQNLAAKNAIDLATIKTDGSTIADAPVGEKMNPASTALWRASLAWGISRFAGVEMVRHGRGESWTVIGRKTDIDLFRTLYARSEMEIDAEAKKYIATLAGRWDVSTRSEGDTFRKYAAAGFRDRLKAYKRESEASTNGQANAAALAAVGRTEATALVLVGREALVKQELTKRFPKLRSISVEGSGSSSAREAGYNYGRSMGVHKASIGG